MSGSPTATRLSEMTGLTALSATTMCLDPQAVYRRLRIDWGGPVVPVELEPGVPAWLVMDYLYLRDMVRDDGRFSRDPRNWRLFAEGGVSPDSGLAPMMFPRDNAYFADHAEHRRLRAPLVEGLANLNELHMSRLIRDTCERLIARMPADGEVDLITSYAGQVPMLTVARFFGLDPDLSEQLQNCLIALFGSGADSQAGNQELETILTDTLRARRAAPVDDLTTALLNHPNLRDDFEIQQAMVLMMSAGWETTQVWIAQTLRLMMTDPRFAARMRGGRLGVDDALDEVLWRDPPMANMPARYATANTVLGDQPIERGDALILGLAAANADPRIRTGDHWQDMGNRAHLAWSTGHHACPAQRAGRLIARVAVETALHQLHNLRLTIPAADIRLRPSPWTRCPDRLPVRFTRTVPRTPDPQEGTR